MKIKLISKPMGNPSSDGLPLILFIMKKSKNISKKGQPEKTSAIPQDKENLKILISKNPNIKTLIKKLDLVLINSSQS
ncbi:MAG: hypothetical protein ABIJ97_18265 [Bacteroidota bacterium]